MTTMHHIEHYVSPFTTEYGNACHENTNDAIFCDNMMSI